MFGDLADWSITGVEVPTNSMQKTTFGNKADENIIANSLNIYPNPFNPTAKIHFSLDTDSKIRLTVYSILGKEIQVLHNGYKNKGFHELTINSKALPSGTYLLSLIIYSNTKPIRLTKKITILK